jgi:hypothetical protein
MKVGLCNVHAVCVSVNSPPPLLTFRHLTQSLWNLVSRHWVHLNGVPHKSLSLICVYVALLSLLGNGSVQCIAPFIARQRLGKQVPEAMNTRNMRRIVGRAYVWVCLYIPLSLLGNNSVKMFPSQRRIVGGDVSYAIFVISRESRQLIFSITSCKHLGLTVDKFSAAFELSPQLYQTNYFIVFLFSKITLSRHLRIVFGINRVRISTGLPTILPEIFRGSSLSS